MNTQYELLRRFTALVERLRTSQQSFFKTHSTKDLEMSKKLEREVDEEVHRLHVTDYGRIEQPTLF